MSRTAREGDSLAERAFRAVFSIAENRVSGSGKLHADLVAAARVRLDLEQCRIAAVF